MGIARAAVGILLPHVAPLSPPHSLLFADVAFNQWWGANNIGPPLSLALSKLWHCCCCCGEGIMGELECPHPSTKGGALMGPVTPRVNKVGGRPRL